MLTKPFPEAEPQTPRDEEVEVFVERLVITEAYHEQLIILREQDGDRRIHLLIGIFEACAIDRAIKGFTAPRPLTHNAWLATIAALGATLRSVTLHRRIEQTYFSELRIEVGRSQGRVDVRPSDAITLALQAGCPILAVDRLFYV